MSPEERAKIAAGNVRAVEQAIREAIVEEREACARAMCPDCDEGFKVDASGHHVHGVMRADRPCRAAAIRARGGDGTRGGSASGGGS